MSAFDGWCTTVFRNCSSQSLALNYSAYLKIVLHQLHVGLLNMCDLSLRGSSFQLDIFVTVDLAMCKQTGRKSYRRSSITNICVAVLASAASWIRQRCKRSSDVRAQRSWRSVTVERISSWSSWTTSHTRALSSIPCHCRYVLVRCNIKSN